MTLDEENETAQLESERCSKNAEKPFAHVSQTLIIRVHQCFGPLLLKTRLRREEMAEIPYEERNSSIKEAK